MSTTRCSTRAECPVSGWTGESARRTMPLWPPATCRKGRLPPHSRKALVTRQLFQTPAWPWAVPSPLCDTPAATSSLRRYLWGSRASGSGDEQLLSIHDHGQSCCRCAACPAGSG
eukprot:425843-Rhodomonas_salina.1